MKHVLIVVVVAGALYVGSLLITPYAHALSIELVLRRIVYLGHFQGILGQIFTAIPLGVLTAITLFLARPHLAVIHIFLGALGASIISFIVVPEWPSHNLFRILGELVFIFTVGAIAWAGSVGPNHRFHGTASLTRRRP